MIIRELFAKFKKCFAKNPRKICENSAKFKKNIREKFAKIKKTISRKFR